MLGVPSADVPLTPGEAVKAGDLTLSLDAEGRIAGLHEDDAASANRRAGGRATALVSLVVEDSSATPSVVSGSPGTWMP